MDRTRSGSTLFIPLLIAVCVVAAIFSFSLFMQIRSVDNRSKKERAAIVRDNKALVEEKALIADEKAVLIKEKESFKGEIDSLKSELKAKTEAIAAGSNDSKRAAERETISRMNTETARKGDEFDLLNKYTPSRLIMLISSREKNENARNLLGDTAKKLDMIKGGKMVMLEPIVVTNGPVFYDQKQGQVLSVDATNKLIVLDQGGLYNSKKEQDCTIYDGEDAICEASVVSMPSALSVLSVKNFFPGRSIKDVKKGLKVVLE